MMLGLAFLTILAHALVASVHLAAHVQRGLDGVALALLLALAPFVGLGLMLRGRPRHGAALLSVTMLAAAVHTLYAHAWLSDDLPASGFDAGVVQMLLAFELQGLCAGLILLVKPEAPRPRETATA